MSLVNGLADHCDRYKLNEKWLVADRWATAEQWKRQLNLVGHCTINLHPATIETIALRLLEPVLRTQRLTFINPSMAAMLIRQLLVDLQRAGKLRYFRAPCSVDGLSSLIARSLNELRLAWLEPAFLTSDRFNEESKANDLRLIYQDYCAQLLNRRIVDRAGAIRLAIAGIEDGSIPLPSDGVILTPRPLTLALAESDLLSVLATRMQVLPRELTSLSANDVDSGESGTSPLEDGGNVTIPSDRCSFFAGYGEVNEVRGALQRLLHQSDAGSARLDQAELVYSDYEAYVPAIIDQLCGWLGDGTESEAPLEPAQLPVTFAEGISCIYTRPGRALRGWLRWTRHEHLQTHAVRLIREGLIADPEGVPVISAARLASTLRDLPIGFQATRYLPLIEQAIQTARSKQTCRDRDSDDATEPPRDHGLEALTTLRATIEPMIRLSPSGDDDSLESLGKATQFLRDLARTSSPFDRLARTRLMEEIEALHAVLTAIGARDVDVLAWLEDLPVRCRMLAREPRPGCLHVSPLDQGGCSGRQQFFVVGLDSYRYPHPVTVDSILLDDERARISDQLPTASQRRERERQRLPSFLERTLDQPNARFWFSYSTFDLGQDRARFPSSALLELFRRATPARQAQASDLLAQLGEPVSFVSVRAEDQLSHWESDLAGQLCESDSERKRQWLESRFPHLAAKRVAREAHHSSAFTVFDGWVPSAGRELDPAAASRMSASRLEMFGSCPRRYFFRYVLGVRPPDALQLDPDRWLDPLQFGSFIHELFDRFMTELAAAGQVPVASRDRDLLLTFLDDQLAEWRLAIPVPNQDALARTRSQLADSCEIFLMHEASYFDGHSAQPWAMEASIGLGEPVRGRLDATEPIPVEFGARTIRLSGRIDRVDRIVRSAGESFAIWDYKSGTDFGFDSAAPSKQGRKLQPLLYVAMLRERLKVGEGGDVDAFGYFFPNPRMQGKRLSWSRDRLEREAPVLESVCDGMAAAAFIATDGPPRLSIL